MESSFIWLIAGIVMILLEFVIPGGIISFLGLSAMIVAGAVYLGWVDSLPMAFLTWFISSILCLLFLRSLLIKYFEGDSLVQNVDEDQDLVGAEVIVIEKITPDHSGRVRFRDTTWGARSEDVLEVDASALIISRDGNDLVIRSK